MSRSVRAKSLMHCVRIHQPGPADSLCWEEAEVPRVQPDEVLVRVKAIGVNFIDTYHRSGLYQVALPFIPGREAAGEVAEVGAEVKEFHVGDRVCFFGSATYAELAVCKATRTVRVPPSVGFLSAAAIMLQGLTAHYLTHSCYALKPGDVVLVHAGAGGTGSLVIQMAKLRGARVITTVSSAEKAEIATALGADHVINYTQTDFADEVKRITNGVGVNVVYDGVGATTFAGSLRCVRRLGHLVLFGNASGKVPPIDPLQLSNQGSITLQRPSLGDFIVEDSVFQQRTSDILGWLESGQLTFRVNTVLRLSQAAEAHTMLESRQTTGKVVLVPDSCYDEVILEQRQQHEQEQALRPAM